MIEYCSQGRGLAVRTDSVRVRQRLASKDIPIPRTRGIQHMAFTAAIFCLESGVFRYMATIIVIDDQMICRQILCQIVNSIDGNHDVRDFASPQEALAWTKHHPVDLVLTDYKMPGMNGIEFIRIFRTQPECTHVPVVMVTSEGEPLVRHEALEAGVTEFMVKPVDLHECRELCRNLLIRYQE